MKFLNRFLDILPALVSWSFIILPIALSFVLPKSVAVFIVIFSVLWFFRAGEFTVFLVSSYIRYQKASRLDWQKKLTNYKNGENLPADIEKLREELIKNNNYIAPNDVIHLVIIPTYKEPLEVLRDTVQSLKETNFDKKKIYVCLATEERDHQQGCENAAILLKEFRGVFADFFHTEHPDNIAGEVRGKGGNITFAGREVYKKIKNKIDIKKTIVTTLDSDNKVHNDFLNALTYQFCITPARKNRSFQPLPFYFNNIWEVPIINRVVSLSSSFWHMIENGRPDRLRNFASHSQPLEALVEMDFWAVDTIVEDGHQYWRSYLHFRGQYAVVPIFLPIYFDACQGKTYFRSIKGQFLQLRRWAWGATDIPFMIKNWWQKRKELPFKRTILQFYRLVEGHIMWAVAPIMIGLDTMIIQMVNSEFQDKAFSVNAAFLISYIFKIAFLGLFIAMAVSFLTMPKPKSFFLKVTIFLQWIILPPITLFFGSMPALTAQTMLAMGKRLEFNVTPKIRIVG